MSESRSTISDKGLFAGTNRTMTIASAAMVIGFLIFTIYNVEFANGIYSNIKNWIHSTLDWYYIGLICVFLYFCVWCVCSKVGSIRLGADDEKPEFSNFSWFSMLFGAGMGIAMLFWSIAEPIYHFQGNPFIDMDGVAAGTAEAAQTAMTVAFFHWGFHGWAIYAVVGLAMAYFSYRKGLPLTIRSALYPVLGDRIYGPIGHLVDLIAIFATIFGVATSLGLGVSQMNAGLNYLFGIDISITNQIILIAVVSMLATMSVVSGVAKGIRILSEWNVRLTAILLLAFLVAGPTIFLLGFFVTTFFGDYLVNMIPIGAWVDTSPDGQWQGWWTVFYWGWYISWAPFVGMFIARISRGRTIREFIVGVVAVPCFVSFVWLILFGGTALHMELYGAGGIVDAVNSDLTTALFVTIEALDIGVAGTIMAAVATVMIITWFITSSDSGTLVISTILAEGHSNPPTKVRVFWGLSEGAVAAVLLFAGGLKALQAASITAALPFSIIMVFMLYGFIRSSTQDPRYIAAPVSASAGFRKDDSLKNVSEPAT